MLKKIAILIFVSQILCLSRLAGQEYFDDDFGLWLGVKTNWKLNKTISLEADAQTRFSENVSFLKRNSLKTGVELRVHKNIRLMTGVLFSEKYMNETAVARYRPYVGVQLRHAVKQFKFRYRNLLQQQTRFNQSRPSVLRDRNQFTVIYSHSKKWETSLSYEIYTDLAGKAHVPFISRQRVALEFIYRVSKHVELTPYLLFQRFFSYNGQPTRNFVTGFTVAFDR